MPITMEYQYQYEVCALLFLLAVTARFFSSRRFPNKPTALFGVVLVCAIADLSLDLLGAYTIHRVAELPAWVNYAVNTPFYTLQVSFPALMMSYVIYSSGRSYIQNARLRWLLAPSAAFVLTLLVNPFTGWIFSVPVVNGAHAYCRGLLFPILYVGTGFYMLATLWLVHCFRADLARRQRATVVAFMLVLAAALLVQFFIPAALLTGVAMTFAILMMFFTLQNPDEMLDTVSGAFNYNAMLILLESKIQKGERLRVVVVDVGGMRRVNSTYGMVVGNRFFSMLGEFLRRLGGKNWVFRMVGTRFMIVLSGEREYRDAVRDIRARFDEEWLVDGNALLLHATIRHFDARGLWGSAEEVVALVDETYAGISAGNWGQCEPIDERALQASHRRTLVENALRTALATGEGLSLHYQPIYHPGSGRFTSAEALLRFDSPELGRVSPAELIPIAEKSGAIFQIDDFVIREACGFLRRHDAPDMLEVNLSASEFFCNPMARIHAIVTQCGADPSRVCFEVTETAADIYPAMLDDFMRGMLNYGYRFALDDFGMGYSNITKVASLPFDVVKLDRSLLNGDEKTRLLFDSLAVMFASIGVATVVEGVETAEQADRVTDKIDYIQGYLYARPMPEGELGAFFGGEARA